MSAWLPCPRCGSDETHRAGARRKPAACANCGWFAAVALVDGRWVAVSGLPGRCREFWRMRKTSPGREFAPAHKREEEG